VVRNWLLAKRWMVRRLKPVMSATIDTWMRDGEVVIIATYRERKEFPVPPHRIYQFSRR